MEALVAPPTTPGWTHIWDYEEQLAISDEVAGSLAFLGIITWSGDYKMYYPINGWDCQSIRERVLNLP